MEKVKRMFQSEKLKGFSKKIFTKKKIGTVIAIIVLIAACRIGFSLMYEVNGTVLKVDTKSIVVANFLGTKTVNTGDYPIDSNRIMVGEKVEITKNLSGDVIAIRTGGGRRGGAINRNGGQPQRGGRFGSKKDGQGRLQNGMPGSGAADGTQVQQ